MFPYSIGAETETQRGQVTGLEVSERVCGRAPTKASADTLRSECPLAVKGSGWAECVQGGRSHRLSFTLGRRSHPLPSA